MLKPLMLALAATVLASPALALSCLRPDAVNLYERARDSDDGYFIVRGEIAIIGPVREPDPETGVPGHTKSRITGDLLTSDGFGASFDREVTIVSTCAGPWCGSATGQEGTLFFAIKTGDDGLTLQSGPCGGDIVAYDGDSAARLLDCHRFGRCRTADGY